MTPQVSLVMPVWRPVGDWFRQAVESALGQTGCTVELIVIDDGNETPLAPFRDERVQLLRIEHGGQSAARNAGIASANGRYIRFIDSDDVLEPGSTARLLALIAGLADVIAHGATVVCDEELNPLKTIASTLEGDVREACLLGRFSVRHESLLFPRQVVERAGRWEDGFVVSADWDFTLRALEHATVRADPAPATYYRRHAQSMTGVAGIAGGEADRRRIIERYFERHPEERGGSLERRAYAELYLDRAFAYARANRRWTAWNRLARAARRRPMTAMRALPALLR